METGCEQNSRPSKVKRNKLFTLCLQMNTMTLSLSDVNDLATITRQLQEARREAEEYKKLYSRKEREAEEYKQQLQNMTQAK
jgi:hypothetical protein